MPSAAVTTTAASGPPPRATARGTVQNFAAQAVMGVAGLAIHMVLTRFLPAAAYGILAVVTSVILWCELLGFQLFLRATTRYVAAAGANWRQAAGTALGGTGAWCGMLTVSIYLFAPLVSHLLGDPGLTPYLRLFCIDVLLYSLFQISRAVLVGRLRYRSYAASFAVYWAFKALAVCGLVVAGFGIGGAIVGSIAASAVGLALAAWTGGAATGTELPLRRLVAFALPLLGATLIYQTLIYMDLWWLKAESTSDATIGHYGLAKNLFVLLVGFTTSVGSAMLPSLTRALEEDRRPSAAGLVHQSFRFVLLFGLGVVAALGVGTETLLGTVFSSSYEEAAHPTFLLAAAAVLFSTTSVATSILTAAGRSWACLLGAVPALPIAIGFNLWLVPTGGATGGGLAAILAGASMALPLLVLVRRELGTLVVPLSLVRIVAAAGIVLLIGHALPTEGLLGLLEPLIGFAAYILLLFLFGELTRHDLELLPLWPR